MPTLKKNITMVEPFAMASLPATLVAIATALFVAVAVARPPTLSPSPSPCHPHPPCRLPPSLPPQSLPPPSPSLSLAPHPCPPHCLPPSSPPQSLPPPSPLLSLAPHPCLRRHRSCHHRQCHHHRSPPSLLFVIALFVASAFTRPPPSSPLRRLGWGRGGPYPRGGCCWHLCSRRHPACQPTAVAPVAAAAGCRRWWWHNKTTTNTTTNKTANTEGG
jgi:hypothetical protein